VKGLFACARLYPPNVGGISLNKNIYFNKLVLIFVFERKNVFSTHYLQFLLTGVTPGTSFPEFSAVGQLDGEQGGYYDSTIRTVILKADWVKKSKDTEHWKMMTQRIFEDQQLVMERLGVHTVQWVYRCELDDDGSKRGYMQCGYDGEDFLSLDLNSLSWIAPVPQALITKHKWEETGHVRFQKHFLLNECIGWLQKYVEYGRSTLERKVAPEVSLFQKDSSSPVVCHATGFFPKAVMISWQKNGEDLNEGVELRETVPNQDGTFQKRSILTLSPEELNRNQYTCIVQHEGLKKKLQVSDRRVLSGEESVGIIVGAVMAVLLVITGCAGVFISKKKTTSGGSNSNTGSESSSNSGSNSNSSSNSSSNTASYYSFKTGSKCSPFS
uniref:Ig-like domain-containing protein n=1 Tax=Astyanax mexicanus TaxID=7994 RepID=A0A3B1IIJ4_ASTMX